MQLCWLRNDLRSYDNSALWHASQTGPVVAVYLISPATWLAHHDAAIKVDFWLRNLATLQTQLTQRNIPLRLIDIDSWSMAAAALIDLARELNAEGIWFNDEYGDHEQQRDAKVQRRFEEAGLHCRRFTDQLLFEPGSLLTQTGTMFKVFSRFRVQAYQQLHHSLPSCVPAPARQPNTGIASTLIQQKIPLSVNGFSPPSSQQQSLWPAGEEFAQQRLQRFCTQRLLDYQQQRNRPDLDTTGSLSAYLNSGVLSPRQCLHAALVHNQGEFDSGNAGIVCWINQLLWREFYKHILACYPDVSKQRAFRPKMDAIPWRDDPEALQRWQQGKTGIPIINAAMRQLLATGWMHNRLRMLCAMLLSKNLLIDWRQGERWFLQHLIDGDLAANNGGWQWCASTGTDAAPYFRIFNPLSQSRKFDPRGDFIRRWLPLLRPLNTRQIHEPSATERIACHDYPAAMVDLNASRKQAINIFSQQ
ncbi:MAG: deoxyribodipyrimidine photo-lyase [Halopseudomonas sp.]